MGLCPSQVPCSGIRDADVLLSSMNQISLLLTKSLAPCPTRDLVRVWMALRKMTGREIRSVFEGEEGLLVS